MTQRRLPFSWVYLVAVVLCFPLLGADGGCGGRDGPTGLGDAAAPLSDATAGCRLSDGRVCPVGTSCPAGDGCNTCSCDASGIARCTLRACPIDGGVMDASRDVCIPECAAPPPGCHYEGPISCSPPSCGRLVCADAGAEIRCGAAGGSFPTFDRSCRATSDCYVAVHQTDCCGNSRAMGINASQRAAFERAEAICQPMYPRCGCPARPPVTDDGAMATFSSMIPVDHARVAAQHREHHREQEPEPDGRPHEAAEVAAQVTRREVHGRTHRSPRASTPPGLGETSTVSPLAHAREQLDVVPADQTRHDPRHRDAAAAVYVEEGPLSMAPSAIARKVAASRWRGV